MRLVSCAALAAIAAGSVAIAQAPQAAPTGAEPDRAARWQEHKAEFDTMRKRRADDVALLIGLRPDQRAGFDRMMASMEPPHRDWGAGKPPMAPGADEEGMAARIARMSARIDQRSAEQKARLDALKSFYASLGPDQRQRFDALDRLRHDHDRMAMHGGRGGHGHGGPEGGPSAPPVG